MNFIKNNLTKENISKLVEKLIQPILMVFFYNNLVERIASENALMRKEFTATIIEVLKRQDAINEKIIALKAEKVVEASTNTLLTTNEIILMTGVFVAVMALLWGFNYASGGSSGSSSVSAGDMIKASQEGLRTSQNDLVQQIKGLSDKITENTIESAAATRFVKEELVDSISLIDLRQNTILDVVNEISVFSQDIWEKFAEIASESGS